MSTPTIYIHRHNQDKNQSLGICYVMNSDNEICFSALSLERGWMDNKKMISCIPAGEYGLSWEYSPAFKMYLWEIKGVPNRSECKFHMANYWTDLNGCIGLGLKLKDFNKDGYKDITNSKNTINSFHSVLKGNTKAKLVITSNYC